MIAHKSLANDMQNGVVGDSGVRSERPPVVSAVEPRPVATDNQPPTTTPTLSALHERMYVIKNRIVRNLEFWI